MADLASDGPPQWLGYVLAIAGNVVVSLSLNTQRYAHKKLEEADEDRGKNKLHSQPDLEEQQQDDRHETAGDDAHDSPIGHDHAESRKTYLSSPYWWAGILLLAVGETGNFLAYAFAPASVVAMLGTCGLIANAAFAPLILHEHFRAKDLLGIALAIAGAVMVVLSADTQDQPTLDPDEILQAIGRLSFEIYAVVVAILLTLLTYLSNRLGDRYIIIDLGAVALFGAFTALSTKGTSSLLSTMLWDAFKYPIFYALIGVLVLTAVMQIRYLNRALARFDSTQVIPIQFCTFTLSVIVASAILYRDFEKMGKGTIVSFFSGASLTFVGVFIISSGRQDNDNEDDEAECSGGDAATIPRDQISQRSGMAGTIRSAMDNLRKMVGDTLVGRRSRRSTMEAEHRPLIGHAESSHHYAMERTQSALSTRSTHLAATTPTTQRLRAQRLSSSQSVQASAPLLVYFVSRHGQRIPLDRTGSQMLSASLRSRASQPSSFQGPSSIQEHSTGHLSRPSTRRAAHESAEAP